MASRFAAGAHPIARDANAARGSRVPVVKVGLYLAGSASIDDGARARDMRPGDIHVFDQSRPWSARYEQHDQCSVFVPHERVGHDPARQPVIRTFRAGSPEGRLLGLAVRAFYRGLEASQDDTPGRLSIVETALHGDMHRSRDPRFRAKRDEGIRMLARNAGSGLNLPASALARDCGVSRATVCRVVRADGGLHRFRKTALLARAFDHLAGQDLQRGDVSRIAATLRFCSTSHFSDAFLDRFGVRPSEAARLRPRAGPSPAGPVNDPTDLEATMRVTRDLYARVTG